MKTHATPSAAAINVAEFFGRLLLGRCGDADRRYLNEVLDDGFGNKESADILQRFEPALAEKFVVGRGRPDLQHLIFLTLRLGPARR